MIPAFTFGQIADGLGEHSFARQQDPDNDQGWKAFYIDM